MADQIVYLHLEPRVTDTGAWCGHCRLPSAAHVELDALGPEGVTPAIGAVTWCTDCENML